MTQLKFLQTLAELTGDAGLFSAGSQASDYVQWAQNRGIGPSGGWKATAKLSSDVLAQSLVQLYGLNPRKYGGDYYRILEREGIVIDRSASVSGEALASLLDNPVVGLKSQQAHVLIGLSDTPSGMESARADEEAAGLFFEFAVFRRPIGIERRKQNLEWNPTQRKRGGDECWKHTHGRHRQRQTERCRRYGQYQRFDDQLPNHQSTPCTERQPHGNLALPAEAPGQYQIRHVGARDQQHQRERRHDQEKHRQHDAVERYASPARFNPNKSGR